MGDFVHLHLHSEYSLLDGACRIDDIPRRAKELNQEAVAITDHGVLYGAVAFYRACRKYGVKPIIGCEVYVATGSRFDKNTSSGHTHLTLLCKNDTGYKNLIKMVSLSFSEGFYVKPRVDKELLKKYSEGLIALSGCVSGSIPKLLSSGEFAQAREEANLYRSIFGEDNFFIELQYHGMEEEKQLLTSLYSLAKDCKIPVVATNDCHYVLREDADTQAVLTCIQMNRTIAEGRPLGFELDEFYMKSYEEMAPIFSKYEGALENTVRIAERCNFDLDFSQTYLPKYPCPKNTTPDQLLTKSAWDGLAEKEKTGQIRYDEKNPKEDYIRRIEYELSVISQMGYSDYFLIVSDYVKYAKSRRIAVGPGRGSGAGSLVAFLLDITEINPLEYGLLFERFLNPERVSMPDIDVDFCYIRRDEVIDYVIEKYGREHVSQIITFGTLAAKAAVRDVGRALGVPLSEVDAIARLIPSDLGITLSEALEQAEDLKSLYQQSVNARRVLDTAKNLEGMPRNVSIHAAGVVITDRPVNEYVPTTLSKGTVITQYDMDAVAKLGLIKFDFLALRYLSILQSAENEIRENDPNFTLTDIDLKDKETFKLLASGDTDGVFQLESAGIQGLLKSMGPSSIDDIIAVLALYRPGPMESIPTYIHNKKHPSKIEYRIPQLKPILESTYGVIVYQEQVMEIFRVLADYSFSHADIVRRAMAKKDMQVLEAERNDFMKGCEKNGIDRETASDIFNQMSSFANYAFNKSHAAAYAMISYRTAYIKAHYFKEYFSALLNTVIGYFDKMVEYVEECRKNGIDVLPPDINKSHALFHVEGDSIRFGLLALKNVGEGFVNSLLKERDSYGPYTSFEGFIDRVSKYDLNKKQVETLIKSGSLDGFGIFRSQLLASYEKILDLEASKKSKGIEGQLDIFSSVSDESMSIRTEYSYPDIPEMSFKDKLKLEKEVSGMYFSGHALDDYSDQISAENLLSLSRLAGMRDGKEADVSVACIITGIKAINTKKGDKMAVIQVEDQYSSAECVLFPKIYLSFGSLLIPDQPVRIDGKVSFNEEFSDKAKITVQSMQPLVSNGTYQKSAEEIKTPDKGPDEKKREPVLFIRLPNLNCRECGKVKNMLEIFCEGNVKVEFYDASTGRYVPTPFHTKATDFLIGQLKSIAGEENVVKKDVFLS